MDHYLRKPTLETLGLGTVLEIFKQGKLPVSTPEMVEKVFGPENNRRALVVSGAGGIVGAGKIMQFASRLAEFNIPIIALDLAGAPDGLTGQFRNLQISVGVEKANRIMNNIVKLTYDGKSLPQALKSYQPAFLLEAIPEKLELKKDHYRLFRTEFPDIHIWSVTSGFPSKELGVGIAHPAFPHEINKVFEIVENSPSVQTQLLWSLGLIPIRVSDDWSFVLDVFFCGLLQASIQFCNRTNIPYWKADKYIRQLLGPNPFRAHDVIGAKGANFLTWSCLYHLGKEYGALFTPTEELEDRKESGQNWYPPNHFRPLVNWTLDESELEDLQVIVYGTLFQMTTIMLHENRSDLCSMNAIGELCAQFTNGIPALIRRVGSDRAIEMVQKYHQLFPQAAETKWYPETLRNLDTTDWQQLYVNAEHDGHVGVITLSRESYNNDVNIELNRAIDWLKQAKINRVILTGDFHLATQFVGADTSEFFPALFDSKAGEEIALNWSKTARRLHTDFETTVGFINGKRCMGGMLELMMHCHYLISVDNATIAMPEVGLPVVPGMEGCHWALRKASSKEERHALLNLLLNGQSVQATDAQGWLLDYTGNMENAIRKAWEIVHENYGGIEARKVSELPMADLEIHLDLFLPVTDLSIEAARKVIVQCIEASCKSHLSDAIHVQAKFSADFMVSNLCRNGKIGTEYTKIAQN